MLWVLSFWFSCCCTFIANGDRSAPNDNFFVRLWVHPVVPPLPLAMLWPKKPLIFTHFAPNSTLFGVGGEGSFVLVISLEKVPTLSDCLKTTLFSFALRVLEIITTFDRNPI